MIKGLFILLKNRSLISRMAYKELTDRYAGSALGLLWALIQPLFLISVYVLVFTFIFRVNLGGDSPPLKYALYAVAGLIPWITMTEALTKSVTAVSSKAALVKQAIFPTEILPISSVIPSFVSLIIGLTITIILILFLAPGQLSFWSLLLPLVIIIHLVFAIGIGYFLSIGGIYFKDLAELVTLILTVGMFVTPILYIEKMVPAIFLLPMQFNPATHLINMYRDLIIYGKINHPWSFLIFTVAALSIFILGFLSFRKVRHLFANVL